MIEATKKIVKNLPNAEVFFVGTAGNGSGANKWTEKIDDLGPRVHRASFDMSEMPDVYKDKDVCVIPTKGAEGTSLSCLEAMASGVPVVASVVGGLPNLIIDHYNGLLINPTPEEIFDAVNSINRYPEMAMAFAQSAYDVSLVHSIDHWNKRWQEVIQEVF